MYILAILGLIISYLTQYKFQQHSQHCLLLWDTNFEKLEDGPRRSGVDVDTFATDCCDLDLWPPESNQVISMGYWIFPGSFVKIVSAVHEILW